MSKLLRQPQKNWGFSFSVNSIYFNSTQLFKLYTGFIHPYTSLLDSVESKAIRWISDPSLTSTFDSIYLPQGGFSISFLPLLLWSLL